MDYLGQVTNGRINDAETSIQHLNNQVQFLGDEVNRLSGHVEYLIHHDRLARNILSRGFVGRVKWLLMGK